MAGVTRTEGQGKTFLHVWNLTTADGIGDAARHPGAADRTVQASGTFGGATVTIEGSINDGVSWGPLRDPGGTAITFTAAGLQAIAENVTDIRARLSVVGVGAAIAVHLLSRSTN